MTNSPVSIVIPAHNEESVIRRTLATLLRGAEADEFEVIVVCNGCCDRTAEFARCEYANAVIIELSEASKTAAINAGLQRAQGNVVLLLDADIELETRSARQLVSAVTRPGVEVAIGHMDVDTEGADPLVRAFYRVWLHHPYLRHGKFAAAMAFSRAGLARIGTMPPVTADDTYLRRLFPAERVAGVDSVHFTVRAPRTVKSLVQVRARSYRGTRQLAPLFEGSDQYANEASGLLERLLRKPMLWPLVPVYLAVTIAARGLSYRNTGIRWERDLTTRIQQAD